MRTRVAMTMVALFVGACSGAQGGSTAPGSDTGADATVDATGDATGDATSDTGSNSDVLFPIDDSSVADTKDVAIDTPDTFVPPDVTCGVPSTPCCAGSSCSVGYCNGGSCWADPYVDEAASDPGLCADLGTTHVSPSFFERFVIHGRPGATAYRYYIKKSCAGAIATLTPDSPFTLAADGTFTETIGNTATPDCKNANLGVLEVWVVVDGRETAHQTYHVFNSACATYSTCGSVSSACP